MKPSHDQQSDGQIQSNDTDNDYSVRELIADTQQALNAFSTLTLEWYVVDRSTTSFQRWLAVELSIITSTFTLVFYKVLTLTRGWANYDTSTLNPPQSFDL